MHQGWPKLVQNLWYRTADGGLTALVFGPSEVTARVGDGAEVTILEQTDYPFGEQISLRVQTSQDAVRFPLSFRVPAWSRGYSIRINGAVQEFPLKEGVCRMDRIWHSGDEVQIDFAASLEVESWYGGSWTLVRGPLVYALRMEEQWEWKAFEGSDRIWGDGAWEVRSSTPWNYALMRDEFKPEYCVLKRSESVAPYPWTLADAPLTLLVPARELPSWTQPEHVAYWTEDGHETGDPVTIELVPYGCTTLRITEFPTRIIPWDLQYRVQWPTKK